MTTRFFDFRKYSYRGKESTNHLPVIKRKVTNGSTKLAHSEDENYEPVKSEVSPPSSQIQNTVNSDKIDIEDTKSSQILHENLNQVEKIFDKSPKRDKIHPESYDEPAAKSGPDKKHCHFSNSIQLRNKSITNSDQLYKKEISSERNNESLVSRKRLKRFLKNDDEDDSFNIIPNTTKFKSSSAKGIKTNYKIISETSESENSIDKFDSDDEAAYFELQGCLEISEVMKTTIINSLGGNDESHREIIRSSFHNGRFNAHYSYNMSDHLIQNSPQILSKLKDYQKCGIHWLLTLHNAHRNGILADEMGLGKTAQTCVFFNHLYASKEVTSPSIIATPASLLDNWLNEIQLWAPNLHGRVLKYQGKQSDRRELILEFIEKMDQENSYCILLTSINTLANNWDLQYLKQIKPLSYLAVDEAHSLKNQNSQIYRKLNKLYYSGRRLLLTGSPVQNRTNELRNLLLFVMPHVFDANTLDIALSYYGKLINFQPSSTKDYSEEKLPESNSKTNNSEDSSFLEKVSQCLSNKSSVSSAPDVQCLQQILAPFILRRLKSEVLADLLSKKSIVIRCQIEGRQASLYLEEIQKRNSRLFISLQKLKNLINPEKPGNVTNLTPDPETTNSFVATFETFKQESPDTPDEDKENIDSESNSGSKHHSQNNKQFVNSLISRLRRICNHPLMMQGYFNDSQITEVVNHYYLHVEGFMGNPRKKVEAEISKWSDFEIHQGILQLIQMNDFRLSHLLIPKEVLVDSAKIKRMMGLVEEIKEAKEKVLIFSQFTTYLNIIEEVLRIALPDVQHLRLDGSTNVTERQHIVNSFNEDPNITIFMLSTKAGGQGLNLSSARNVILMDQDWNPHNDRQAEDRVHRLGQTKEVIIYRLCCRGTIEETILECCQKKLDLDEAFGGDSELLQAAILQESIINSKNIH